MFFYVMFCGFLLMVHGVQAVTMCNVGMMGGLFMASGRIMLGSFLVVACCMFVVLRCLGMMFCAFFAHNMILVSCFWLMLGKKQCSITSVPKAHVALRVLRWEFILFLEAVVRAKIAAYVSLLTYRLLLVARRRHFKGPFV
ncbi:MAG: hypothetical protein JO170_20990 [Verrucomicrobia bacterium]|nr:hypothetical protein [Verrucomicrobiota bacterium]